MSTFPIHYDKLMGPVLCGSSTNSHSHYTLIGATALSYTREFHNTPPQSLAAKIFQLSFEMFHEVRVSGIDVLLRVEHLMFFVLTETQRFTKKKKTLFSYCHS